MVINHPKNNNPDNSISAINQRIKEILVRREKVRLDSPSRKPSGVLIPLYVKDGQHYLVLTRRSQLVRYHKGQVSFPGGGYHRSDGTLRQTALRESFEEIGLDPTQVEIWGELDDNLTFGSNFIIAPFVGLIPADYPFKLSDFETGEILHVPVKALLMKDACRADQEVVLDGCPVKSNIYTYKEHVITGATARIVKQFLEIYSQAAAS
jgi:8-oxo-dGTP pyrophosphatase MutT (NUDIX family)